MGRTGPEIIRLRLWLRLIPWTSNEELPSVQSALCASPRQNACSPVRLSPSLLMPLGSFYLFILKQKICSVSHLQCRDTSVTDVNRRD